MYITWSEMNCSIMELALYLIRNIHVDCGLPLMSPYRNSETVQIISPKQCMTIERQMPTLLHYIYHSNLEFTFHPVPRNAAEVYILLWATHHMIPG